MRVIAQALASAALAAFLALSGPPPATANDSTAELGVGGLVLTANSGIAMKSEDLRISANLIEVRYEFLNETDKDITTLVAFPMPLISANDADFQYALPKERDPVNFIGFTVTVDGQKIAPEVEQRARVHGVDITDRLKADGIPLNPFPLQRGREALARLSPDKRKFYVERGLAIWSEGQPTSVAWDVATTFFWMQTFPAQKVVSVQHSYTPVVGTGFLTETVLAGPPESPQLMDYCIDKGTNAGIRKIIQARKVQNGADEPGLFQTRLQYVLLTGANWAGPIRDFRMSINKPTPDTIMSFCFDGKLQKISPTTFTFAAKNYTPSRNLSILFVNPNRSN
ncbi:DUF4424 family protein [Prosthecomicrobium sp. N25]|uniref:DUF4424 family protein n=1 Tax=Prosthecomicrobium sp. N25 TaxID=3129254 RepID=UPI00307748F7